MEASPLDGAVAELAPQLEQYRSGHLTGPEYVEISTEYLYERHALPDPADRCLPAGGGQPEGAQVTV